MKLLARWLGSVGIQCVEVAFPLLVAHGPQLTLLSRECPEEACRPGMGTQCAFVVILSGKSEARRCLCRFLGGSWNQKPGLKK